MPDLLQCIKKAAVDAVESSGPMEIRYGKVISADPLKIQVDQKTIYSDSDLILTRNVMDFDVDVSISAQTEAITHGHPVTDTYTGGGTAEKVDHNHPIRGRKKLKIHNALVVGDAVFMLRSNGKGKIIVLDRLKPNPALKGEWL